MDNSQPHRIDISPGQSEGGPACPRIPDHQMIRRIGSGAYGEVWLAKNIMGACRAVKVVFRQSFDNDRPFEREFHGIEKFEPISRSHESQVNILHVGRGEGYFYYVMELADDGNDERGVRSADFDRRVLMSAATYTPKTLKSEKQRRGFL